MEYRLLDLPINISNIILEYLVDPKLVEFIDHIKNKCNTIELPTFNKLVIEKCDKMLKFMKIQRIELINLQLYAISPLSPILLIKLEI
ncbi:hypothetical protein N9T73_00450, partial [bacterium]|nr:hypothetical protein [bacterium]